MTSLPPTHARRNPFTVRGRRCFFGRIELASYPADCSASANALCQMVVVLRVPQKETTTSTSIPLDIGTSLFLVGGFTFHQKRLDFTLKPKETAPFCDAVGSRSNHAAISHLSLERVGLADVPFPNRSTLSRRIRHSVNLSKTTKETQVFPRNRFFFVSGSRKTDTTQRQKR